MNEQKRRTGKPTKRRKLSRGTEGRRRAEELRNERVVVVDA